MPSTKSKVTTDQVTALARLSQPMIARRAAQLWEKRGRPDNRDEEIWLEAERLLLSDRGQGQPAAEESLRLKTRVQLTFGQVKHSPEERSQDPGVASADDSAFVLKVSVIARQLEDSPSPIDPNTQLLLELNDQSRPESAGLIQRKTEVSRLAPQAICPWTVFSQDRAPEFQPLDLNQVLDRNLGQFLAATKRKIELEFRYAADLPLVLADSSLLGHVIWHLVVNSIEAMPQGGRISLTTERHVMKPSCLGGRLAADSEKFACLTISDTGCGIPSANLSRIFEPRFTTKDPRERSGMGLAIVHRIVQQHRGWIEVASQADCGTTFKILLPGIASCNALAATAFGRDEAHSLSQREIPLLAAS